ncbi:MAG: GxxExxY protein [Bacillota bacterium]|jgi:GxxExxY protein|nr:GxxExxY protein [Bacillota bacterium]
MVLEIQSEGRIDNKRKGPDKEVDRLAHEVIGAAIEVHRHLGPGYLESVYEEALAVELNLRGIPFVRQKTIAVNYKGHPVGEGRLDFLVGESLVVELKAVDALAPIHKAQLLSYLKTTGFRLGLLINFNVSVLKEGIQRVIL